MSSCWTFKYLHHDLVVVQYLVDDFCILRDIHTKQCMRCKWPFFVSICPGHIVGQCVVSTSPCWGPGQNVQTQTQACDQLVACSAPRSCCVSTSSCCTPCEPDGCIEVQGSAEYSHARDSLSQAKADADLFESNKVRFMEDALTTLLGKHLATHLQDPQPASQEWVANGAANYLTVDSGSALYKLFASGAFETTGVNSSSDEVFDFNVSQVTSQDESQREQQGESQGQSESESDEVIDVDVSADDQQQQDILINSDDDVDVDVNVVDNNTDDTESESEGEEQMSASQTSETNTQSLSVMTIENSDIVEDTVNVAATIGGAAELSGYQKRVLNGMVFLYSNNKYYAPQVASVLAYHASSSTLRQLAAEYWNSLRTKTSVSASESSEKDYKATFSFKAKFNHICKYNDFVHSLQNRGPHYSLKPGTLLDSETAEADISVPGLALEGTTDYVNKLVHGLQALLKKCPGQECKQCIQEFVEKKDESSDEW